MTDEERIEAFNEGVEFCEKSLAADLAEFARLREREQLVANLLTAIAEIGCRGDSSNCQYEAPGDGDCELCVAYRTLRDFTVTL